jgi:hypothetical protein
MAPEFPPRLVVLDLSLVGDSLVGKIEYVEGGNTHERLSVLWTVDPDRAPPGYFSVGGGVVYVKEANGVCSITAAEHGEIPSLGAGRWAWMQGLPPEQDQLMVVMILPEGHTIDEADPLPVRAKQHRGRIAVYYFVQADQPGRRIRVAWSMPGPPARSMRRSQS